MRGRAPVAKRDERALCRRFQLVYQHRVFIHRVIASGGVSLVGGRVSQPERDVLFGFLWTHARRAALTAWTSALWGLEAEAGEQGGELLRLVVRVGGSTP